MMSLWYNFSQLRSAPLLLRIDNLIHRYVTHQILAPTRIGIAMRATLTVLIGIMIGVGVTVAGDMSSKNRLMVLVLMLLPFAMMLVNNLRLVMLAIIPFETAIPVDTNLNYREDLAVYSAIAGFNISITAIVLVALYFFWITQMLAQRGELARLFPKVSLPHLGYFLATLLSMRVATDPSMTLNEVILIFYALLLTTYIISTFSRREELQFMMIVVCAVLVLQGLLMIGVFLIRDDIRVGPLFVRFDSHTGRVGGTLGSPNGAATYLVMMLPITVVGMAMFQKRWLKQLATAAFILGVTGLFLTQSRGGLIGFTVSMMILSLMAAARGWMKLKWPLMIAYVGMIPMVMLAPILFARFLSDDGGSAESRGPLAEIAMRMIEDHWVFGVGANNFAIVKDYYVTPEFADAWLSTVHNHFLRVWAEMGIIGLGAYLVLIITTLYIGLLCWEMRGIDPLMGMLAIALSAGILGLQLQLAFELFNARTPVHTLWFTSGLVIASYTIARRERRALPAAQQTAPPAALAAEQRL